jgi:hypothetical protein
LFFIGDSVMTESTNPETARSPNAPHSWEFETWPADVWPHTARRAKWIAKAHRTELTKAGALTRVGKKLIFMGAKYTRWLERRSQHVVEFESNNPGLNSASQPRA